MQRNLVLDHTFAGVLASAVLTADDAILEQFARGAPRCSSNWLACPKPADSDGPKTVDALLGAEEVTVSLQLSRTAKCLLGFAKTLCRPRRGLNELSLTTSK